MAITCWYFLKSHLIGMGIENLSSFFPSSNCSRKRLSDIFFWMSSLLILIGSGTPACKSVNNLQFPLNPLSANPTKWSNTLKQFVGKFPTNCLSVFEHFVKLALKGLNLWKVILHDHSFRRSDWFSKTWNLMKNEKDCRKVFTGISNLTH